MKLIYTVCVAMVSCLGMFGYISVQSRCIVVKLFVVMMVEERKKMEKRSFLFVLK